MSKGFNLTAEINLRGPANIRTVVADIRRQLGTVTANVDIKLNPSTARNINALTQNLSRLNSVLGQTNTLSNQASNALNNLARAGGNVTSNITNVARATQNVSSAVNQISTSSNQAGKALFEARTEFEEFGKQSALAVRRFAAFATVTSVIFKISNAISSATSEYLAFNKELVRVAQVTDSSVSSLSSLESRITALSTSFGVASKDLIQISSTLAQAGLTAKDTEKALNALALSALAPSFDSLNDTVEGSIALMRQFGIGAGDLEKALGSINAVSAKFAVESSDIITAIQRTGGVFAAASRGVSEGKDALNEFIAVFTSVRATTRESAETIATGLRTIFTRIQRADTIDALKEYGVTLTDLQGKFVGPYEAVKRLAQGLGQLDPRDLRFSRIVEELGGFRQIGKVIPLIQQFTTAQQALIVAQKGQGSLTLDAATAQQALAVKIAKVREEFIAMIRSVGQSESFKSFVNLSLDLASGLIKVADAAKNVLPALTAITAIRGASFLTQFATGFIGGIRTQKKYTGGRIAHFATGGLVPGTGNEDNFPAMLQPGEFVMRKTAVDSIGKHNLRAMNSGGSLKSISKFMGGSAGGISDESVSTNKPGKITKSGGVFIHLVKAPTISGSSSLVQNLQKGASPGAPILGLSNLGIMLHGVGPGLNQDLAKKIAKFPKEKFIQLINSENPRTLFGRQLQLPGMSRPSGAGSFRSGKKSQAYKMLDNDQILKQLQQILISASSQYLPNTITQDADLYPVGKALYSGALSLSKDLGSGFSEVRELKYNLDTSKNPLTGEYNNTRYGNRVKRMQTTGRRLTSEVQPRFSRKFQKEQSEGLVSFNSDDEISYHNLGGKVQKFMDGGETAKVKKPKETRSFGSGEYPFPKRISNAYFKEIDAILEKQQVEKAYSGGLGYLEYPSEKRIRVESSRATETFDSTTLDRAAFAESFKKRVSALSIYKDMSNFAKFIGLPREDLSLALPEHIDFAKMGGLGAGGQFDRTGMGHRGFEGYDLSSSGYGPAQEQDLYGYEKLVAEKQKEMKKILKTPIRTFPDGSFSYDTVASKKTWDEINDLQIKIMNIKKIKLDAQHKVGDQIRDTAQKTGRGAVSINTSSLGSIRNSTLYHELTHQLFQGLRTRSADSFDKYKQRVVQLFGSDNDQLADAFDALENSYNSADVVYGRSYKIGLLDQVIQNNRTTSGKMALTPTAQKDAYAMWTASLPIKKAKEYQPINPNVNKALLDNSIKQNVIDRVEDSGKEEFLTTLVQNANRLDPLLQGVLDTTLSELLGSVGIARQQYADGGIVSKFMEGGVTKPKKAVVTTSPTPPLKAILARIAQKPKELRKGVQDYAFQAYREELTEILNQAYRGVLSGGMKPTKDPITPDSVVSFFDQHSDDSRGYVNATIKALEDDLKYVSGGNTTKGALKPRKGVSVGDMLDTTRAYQALGLDYVLNSALASGKTNETLGDFMGEDLPATYAAAGVDKVKISEFVKHMNAAAQYKFPKKLYSGLGDSKLDIILKQTGITEKNKPEDLIGRTFTMPSFLSASDAEALAVSFARTGMLTITPNPKKKGIIPEKSKETTVNRESLSERSKKSRLLQTATGQKGFAGIPIDESYADAYDQEGEYIFPANSRFKITDIEKFGVRLFDKSGRNIRMDVQQLGKGGVVERKIGIIDTDVLRDPINANIVGPAMQQLGLTSVSQYSIELAKLATQARKASNLSKLTSIAGAAGSGKSSLATGRGANDEGTLRKTIRSQILSPDDIAKVNEIIVLTSTVSEDKLNEYLRDVDRAYVLSSSTESEKERLVANRANRDATGEGLYGRKPGTTSSAPRDFTLEETILRDELGKKAMVLGRKGNSFGLRRKRESELPEIVQAAGFYTGGFAPPTAGHKGAFETLLANVLAKNPNASAKDILVSVAPNLAMGGGEGDTEEEKLAHASRYGIFPADFRSLLASVNFPGAMISTQESVAGSIPKMMEVQGVDGRRRFARTKGALAITSGKEAGVLGKYQRAGLEVTDIPRIDDISATKVRKAIFDGDDKALSSFLNPQIASVLMGNRAQLRNRSMMVPMLIEEIKKYAETQKTKSNAEVEQLLKSAPGGPYSRVDKKLKDNAPEVAMQIKNIRDQRDRIAQGLLGYRAHNIIALLSSQYPEAYGLDATRRATVSAPPADLTKEAMAAHVSSAMQGEFDPNAAGAIATSSLQQAILEKVTKETATPKGSGELPTTAKEILAKLGDRVLPTDSKFGEFAGKKIRDTAKGAKLGYWMSKFPDTLATKPEKLAAYEATRDYIKDLYSGTATETTSQALATATENISQSTLLAMVGLYGKNALNGPLTWNLGKNAQGEDVNLTATIMERVLPAKYKQVADYISSQTSGIVTKAAEMMGKKDPKKLTEKQKGVLNQGNIEGGILEQLLAVLGGDVLDDALRTRAVDFPSGIGAFAAEIFGIPANIPTEAKRTIDSNSRADAIEEFQRHFRGVYGVPDPEKTVKKLASGGPGGVTALVSNGEAFVPPELAKQIGYSKLDQLNQADRNGLSGFASGGGISIFKGPGSGTSDSIGPLTLPVGGYVLREKATKALGLGFSKGGGVGKVQRFVSGGKTQSLDDMALEQQAKKIAAKLMQGGMALGDALDQARKDVMDSVQGPSRSGTSMVPQEFTTPSGTRLTNDQKAATAIPVSMVDIQQQRLERRAALRGAVVGGFEVDDNGRVKGNRRVSDQGADITKVGTRGSQQAFDGNAANRAIGYSFQYDTLGGMTTGRVAGSNITAPQNTPYQIGRTASSSSAMSPQRLQQILNSMTTSAQQSAGFFQQIKNASSSVATKTVGMFGNIKNFMMGTHTLKGKPLDEKDIQRREARAGRIQQMGMGLAFSAPMYGEMLGSAVGGTKGAGIASAATSAGATMGVAMQFAPMLGPLAPLAVLAGAAAAAASAIDGFAKGAAEAEKQISEKKIQAESERADKSLQALEKDPRNAIASQALTKSIEKIAAEEDKIKEQNKIINAPTRMGKFINTVSFGYFGDKEKTPDQAAQELAQRNTAADKESSDRAMQALSIKINSGMTMEESLKSMGNPELIKQQIAEGVGGEFALKNAKLQQTREKFAGKTDSTSLQIVADIDAGIKANNEAAFKSATEMLRAVEADKQRAKAAQALAKALNQASVSVDRTFSNMESALAKGTDVLNKTSESLSALASNMVSTKGNFSQQNVLENPNAYSAKERQQAVTSASAIFGQDAGFVQRLTNVGSKIKDTIASLSVGAQQSGQSKEVAAENIQRTVDKQLRDAFGDNNLSRQISEQIKLALKEQVNNKDTKEIDLDKLLSETSGLTNLLEAEKKAFKALTDATKLAADSISLYSETVDKAITMMNEANNIRAESVGSRASNEFRMTEVLGGKVSLSDRLGARRNEGAARLGIKPDQLTAAGLQARLASLTQQRSAVEQQRNTYQANNPFTDPRTVAGINNFNKTIISLNNDIKLTQDALKNLPKDIQGMLDDTFNELQKKVGEFEARQQAGAAFGEKLVTSTPTELTDLNNTYTLLNNTLNGQIRTIQQSSAAQQAYKKVIDDGGTAQEAMTAAQSAFANENKNVFSMFSEMINMGNFEKPEANRMRADLLENMARSQGLNIQNNPIFARVIENLRKAPEEDPEVKKLKTLYDQLSAAQQEAFKTSSESIMNDASKLITQAAQEIKKAIESAKISFDTQQLAGVGLGIARPATVMTKSEGGIVYASSGKFIPRGTDTVPAMLSPGEFVVNAQSTKANLPVLDAINKSKGGPVYLASGTSKPVAKPVMGSTPFRTNAKPGTLQWGYDYTQYMLENADDLLSQRYPGLDKSDPREYLNRRLIFKGVAQARLDRFRRQIAINRGDRGVINSLGYDTSRGYSNPYVMRNRPITTGGEMFGPPRPPNLLQRAGRSAGTAVFTRVRDTALDMAASIPEFSLRNVPSRLKDSFMRGGMGSAVIGSVASNVLGAGINMALDAMGASEELKKFTTGAANFIPFAPFLASVYNDPSIRQVVGYGGRKVGGVATRAVSSFMPKATPSVPRVWTDATRLRFNEARAAYDASVAANDAKKAAAAGRGARAARTTTQTVQAARNASAASQTATTASKAAGTALRGARGTATAIDAAATAGRTAATTGRTGSITGGPVGFILGEMAIQGVRELAYAATDNRGYVAEKEQQTQEQMNAGMSGDFTGVTRFSSNFAGNVFGTDVSVYNPMTWIPGRGIPSAVGRVAVTGRQASNAAAQAVVDQSETMRKNAETNAMAITVYRNGKFEQMMLNTMGGRLVRSSDDPTRIIDTQTGIIYSTVFNGRTESPGVLRGADQLFELAQSDRFNGLNMSTFDRNYVTQRLSIEEDKTLDRDTRNKKLKELEDSRNRKEDIYHRGYLWNTTSKERNTAHTASDAEMNEALRRERQGRIDIIERRRKEREDRQRARWEHTVSTVQNIGSNIVSGAGDTVNAALNFGTSLYDVATSAASQAMMDARIRDNRQRADKTLANPSVPESLDQMRTFREERKQLEERLNSIQRPQHPFDKLFDKGNGAMDRFGGSRMVKDPRTERLITKQEYETAYPNEMRTYGAEIETYQRMRQNVQQEINRKNEDIIGYDSKIAENYTPEERRQAWKDYNKSQADQKAKMEKAAEREEKMAAKKAERAEKARQAGLVAAIAQVSGIPLPKSPMAIAAVRKRMSERLASSFGPYASKNVETLRSYGINEDVVKFLFHAFSDDQNKVLAEIVAKNLYSTVDMSNRIQREDFNILKASYGGPNGILEYAKRNPDKASRIIGRKEFLENLKYKEYGKILQQAKQFDDLAFKASSAGPSRAVMIRSNLKNKLIDAGYIDARGKPEDNARRLNALGFKPYTVQFMYPGQASGMMAGRFNTGGVVYASTGKYVNFEPRGTDTVPAMLTPGEFVVNARATAQHLPLLQAINQSKGGNVKHLNSGGMVYLQQGGGPVGQNKALNERIAYWERIYAQKQEALKAKYKGRSNDIPRANRPDGKYYDPITGRERSVELERSAAWNGYPEESIKLKQELAAKIELETYKHTGKISGSPKTSFGGDGLDAIHHDNIDNLPPPPWEMPLPPRNQEKARVEMENMRKKFLRENGVKEGDYKKDGRYSHLSAEGAEIAMAKDIYYKKYRENELAKREKDREAQKEQITRDKVARTKMSVNDSGAMLLDYNFMSFSERQRLAEIMEGKDRNDPITKAKDAKFIQSLLDRVQQSGKDSYWKMYREKREGSDISESVKAEKFLKGLQEKTGKVEMPRPILIPRDAKPSDNKWKPKDGWSIQDGYLVPDPNRVWSKKNGEWTPEPPGPIVKAGPKTKPSLSGSDLIKENFPETHESVKNHENQKTQRGDTLTGDEWRRWRDEKAWQDSQNRVQERKHLSGIPRERRDYGPGIPNQQPKADGIFRNQGATLGVEGTIVSHDPVNGTFIIKDSKGKTYRAIVSQLDAASKKIYEDRIAEHNAAVKKYGPPLGTNNKPQTSNEAARSVQKIVPKPPIKATSPSVTKPMVLPSKKVSKPVPQADPKPAVKAVVSNNLALEKQHVWYGDKKWDLNNDGKAEESIIGRFDSVTPGGDIRIIRPDGRSLLLDAQSFRRFANAEDMAIVRATKPDYKQNGGVIDQKRQEAKQKANEQKANNKLIGQFKSPAGQKAARDILNYKDKYDIFNDKFLHEDLDVEAKVKEYTDYLTKQMIKDQNSIWIDGEPSPPSRIAKQLEERMDYLNQIENGCTTALLKIPKVDLEKDIDGFTLEEILKTQESNARDEWLLQSKIEKSLDLDGFWDTLKRNKGDGMPGVGGGASWYGRVIQEQNNKQQKKNLLNDNTLDRLSGRKNIDVMNQAEMEASADDLVKKLLPYTSSKEGAQRLLRLRQKDFGIVGVRYGDQSVDYAPNGAKIRGSEAWIASHNPMSGNRSVINFREQNANEGTVQHEMGHAIQTSSGNLMYGHDGNRIGKLKLIEKDLMTFLTDPNGWPKLSGQDQGSTGGYTSEQLMQNPHEIFTSIIESMDHPRFEENLLAKETLSKIMRVYGFKTGGVVYAQNGNYIPFRTPRDKALNDRRLEVQQRQEILKKAALLDKLRKQLDAQLMPADKQAQVERDSRMKRYAYDDEMQRRKDSVIDPEEIKFANDLTKENRKFQAEQARENARLEYETAKTKRFNTVNLPPIKKSLGGLIKYMNFGGLATIKTLNNNPLTNPWLNKSEPPPTSPFGNVKRIADAMDGGLSFRDAFLKILRENQKMDEEDKTPQWQKDMMRMFRLLPFRMFSNGGIVYASDGTLVPYQPRGTDTVPAMLTPGEFVINRESTSRHLPLLKAINSGAYNNGGVVYAQYGAYLGSNGANNMDQFTNINQFLTSFGNSLTTLTDNISKLNSQITLTVGGGGVNNGGKSQASNLDGLGTFVNKIDQLITNLGSINLPPIISLQVQPITLNITGGEALAKALQGPMSEQIKSEIAAAFSRLNSATEGAINIA